jgi:hypothetical protein
VRWATLAVRAGGTESADGDEAGDSRRRRLPGPALQGLIALAIYVALMIVAFSLSLIGQLDKPAVGQTEVDPNFYIWAWRWWTYAVSHWTNPLYSFQIGAPAGYNLAWATTSPTVALLMWPITATAGPVFSFNLTLVLAPATAAWAAFVLTRRMTGRFWAALPAGAIFGFNVYMLAHSVSGQPNLTVTLLLPLIGYLVLRWWQGSLGRVGYLIWMTVAIALEFYTFIEAYAMMTLLFGIGLVLALAVVRKAERRKVIELAVLSAVAYVGALVLSAPYLVYALKNTPSELTRQLPQFSLDLGTLVLPRSDRLLGMEWLHPAAGHVLAATAYFGVPLLLLWALFGIFGWKSRLTRLLTIGFFITIVLSLGPVLNIDGQRAFSLPWGGMWSLPFFRSAEPIRLVDFGYLILSVAFALWVAQITQSKLVLAARWLLAALALAAMFANLPTFASVTTPAAPKHWKPSLSSQPPTNTIPAFFTDGRYKQYIKPGENVVIISHRGNAAMLFQAYTDFYFRIDGGFINASLSRVDALPVAVAELSYPTPAREQAFERYVRASGLGAIIIEDRWSEKWMKVFAKFGMKPMALGGVTVYQTSQMNPVATFKDPGYHK